MTWILLTTLAGMRGKSYLRCDMTQSSFQCSPQPARRVVPEGTPFDSDSDDDVQHLVYRRLKSSGALSPPFASRFSSVPPTTMKSAKNIQAKVFGGQDSSNAPPSPANGSPQPPDGPQLSINIPKPPPFKVNPQKPRPPQDEPLKHKASSGDIHRKSEGTYREHLLKKLGTKYDGVERYRLEQDEERKRHWKRWGPYLSERQWVRFSPSCYPRE